MTKPNPLILPFSNIRYSDLPLVGGKGANLGELTHAGLPVPDGFCVTTVAFDVFMHASEQSQHIYELLDSVDVGDVKQAHMVGQEVRDILRSAPLPDRIISAMKEEWEKRGRDQAYAVRSSATAEDLPEASFAGQQDTYLNVRGEEALLDAVRSCWASLFTDRAILYRRKNHFAHRDVKLSVVIQQMVFSEVSGTLFTADPLTGHRHTLSIDASYGLGEALVRGLVSPDAYRVDTREMQIIDTVIAEKKVAIYPQEGGGTIQTEVRLELRNKKVLTDGQIIALARMGAQVEAHYGRPQDVEWGIVGGMLFLLQSRPITSLYPIDGLTSHDGTLHIYFSLGHQQMMTDAMSPLGASTMRVVVPFGRKKGSFESSILVDAGGRLFGDFTKLLRHPIFKKIIFGAVEEFDALGPKALELAMKRKEFQAPHNLKIPFANKKVMLGIFAKVVGTLLWKNLDGNVDKANQHTEHYVQHIREALQSIDDPVQAIERSIKSIQGMPQVALSWIPQFVAGSIAEKLIEKVAGDSVTSHDLEAYKSGLDGNVVNEMNRLIADLSERVRHLPEWLEHFQNLGQESHDWLQKAREIDQDDVFFEPWNRLIERYGSRGSGEIDIANPRWYEEPLPLLQVIAMNLKKEEGSHRTLQKKLIHKRQQAEQNIIRSMGRGWLGWFKSRWVKRLIYVAQYGMVLREHHKFLLMQIERVVKEKLKEIASGLVDAQTLTDKDDLYYLTWDELYGVVSGTHKEVVETIPQRKAELARFAKLTPPLVITSDGEIPMVTYEAGDAPEGALLGNPVSAGVVEGIVRIIDDPNTQMLYAGEILVAPFTDPGWTPLFINASGLITEVGGIMTHGSVVAREYGLPAVVGVRNATTLLKTGQKVRVDGNKGVIEILNGDEREV